MAFGNQSLWINHFNVHFLEQTIIACLLRMSNGPFVVWPPRSRLPSPGTVCWGTDYQEAPRTLPRRSPPVLLPPPGGGVELSS